MPLAVKINVALREQNCQKIGSERVNLGMFNGSLYWNLGVFFIYLSGFCHFGNMTKQLCIQFEPLKGAIT